MTTKFIRFAIATAAAAAMALPAGGAMAGTSKTESALLGGLLLARSPARPWRTARAKACSGRRGRRGPGRAVGLVERQRHHNYRSARSYRDSRPYSGPAVLEQYAPLHSPYGAGPGPLPKGRAREWL